MSLIEEEHSVEHKKIAPGGDLYSELEEIVEETDQKQSIKRVYEAIVNRFAERPPRIVQGVEYLTTLDRMIKDENGKTELIRRFGEEVDAEKYDDTIEIFQIREFMYDQIRTAPTPQEKISDLAFVFEMYDDLLANVDIGAIKSNLDMHFEVEFIREYFTDPIVLAQTITAGSEYYDLYAFYAAVEFATAGDYDEAEKYLQSMHSYPHIQIYLKRLLSEAQNYQSATQELAKDVSSLHLLKMYEYFEIKGGEIAEPEKATDIRVTVNTTIQSLRGILDPYSAGRFLNATEFATPGGAAEKGTNLRKRNHSTRAMRDTMEERAGAASYNIFNSQIVYGAITSAEQPIGPAPTFGNVLVYVTPELANSNTTRFVYGDSLDWKNFGSHGDKRTLNYEDAITAYEQMRGQTKQDSDCDMHYIEALLPGLKESEITAIKVLYPMRSGLLDQYEETLELADKRGIATTIAFELADILDNNRQFKDEIALSKDFISDIVAFLESVHTRLPNTIIEIQVMQNEETTELRAELANIEYVNIVDYSSVANDQEKHLYKYSLSKTALLV